MDIRKKIRDVYEHKQKQIQAGILLAVYVCFFLWGMCSYQDYGISWDEKVQREHGFVHLKYVYEQIHGAGAVPEGFPDDIENLETYSARYYGIGIKIPLILIEYLHGFQMSARQVYEMNHLYTFLLFFCASIFVYRIAKKLKYGFWYSLLAVLLLISCPRILADAFYNVKDSVFLSLFVMMLYDSICVMEKFRLRSAARLAVSAAFCLNTRIVGAFPLGITCIFYICRQRDGIWKRMAQVTGTGAVSALIYMLMTPASWGNFLDYIGHAVRVFSNYQHIGYVALGQRIYPDTNLPWYYTVFCIFATVPLLYSVGSVTGIFAALKELTGKKSPGQPDLIQTMLLVQFLSVLLYDACMRPIKYNMWRHFYFLFIYLALFTAKGIRYAWETGRIRRFAVGAGVCGSMAVTCIWIVMNHPYEYTYYNMFLPTDDTDAMLYDYWHVSGQDLLQLISSDPDRNVYVGDCSGLYFGESGWENYHYNYEKDGAEYKTDYSEPGTSLQPLYRTLDTIQVGDKTIGSLLQRIHYHDCLQKCFISQDGAVKGDQGQDGMKWEVTSDLESRCFHTVIPESYRVRQIDFLTTEKNAVKNVFAYGSLDGVHWKLYPKESHTYVGDTMFSVISTDAFLPYFRIRFDENVTAGEVNYAVRVYGENSCGITALSGNCNEQELHYVVDADPSTRWCSNIMQKAGMEIRFSLEQERLLKGIRLSIGQSLGDYPKELVIQYKNKTETWMDIPYTTQDNENYIFDFPQKCSQIRLVNQMDDDNVCWSIYELEPLYEENYYWTNQDTKEAVEDLTASDGSDTVWELLDHDPDTRWCSKEPMHAGMHLKVKVRSKQEVLGFHLDTGSMVWESARGIKIYGSDAGENWEELSYRYSSASDYLLDQPQYYQYYRIEQTGADDTVVWSVAEFGILRSAKEER